MYQSNIILQYNMSFRIKIAPESKKINFLKETLLNSKVKLPLDYQSVDLTPKKLKKSSIERVEIKFCTSRTFDKMRKSQQLSPTKQLHQEMNLRNTWHGGSTERKSKSSGALIKFKNIEVRLNAENPNGQAEPQKKYDFKQFSSTLKPLKNRSYSKNTNIKRQKMLNILRMKLKNRFDDEFEKEKDDMPTRQTLTAKKSDSPEKGKNVRSQSKQMIRKMVPEVEESSRMQSLTGWAHEIKEEQEN